jgi:SAM-dependent methyltransferase
MEIFLPNASVVSCAMRRFTLVRAIRDGSLTAAFSPRSTRMPPDMARWDHGYVTDVAYTTNAYQETMPSWLAASSILLGYRPPDLSLPFRYADLGCGNGLGLLIAAATNPHAEFLGFDFNPTHIENARSLATQAKLSNVHFEEVSFEALAHGVLGAGDAFDIMVSHGVLSWISPENRGHLISIIARRLRPGGLVYLSYNVKTGWAEFEPIRLLMRQLADADPRRTDQVTPDIFQRLDQLRTGGALFFRAHSGLEGRLEQMRGQDPRYIAHEFLNRDWNPLMFAEVAEAMEETRTSYIGSATLMENVDAIATQDAIQALIQAMPTVAARETVRDLASARTFRRDLWRRGGEPMSGYDHLALLDRLTLVWTGKAIEDEISFPGPIGTVTGQPAFYRPFLEAVRDGPVTIGQLRSLPALEGRQPGEFIQGAILAMGAGYAHPAWGTEVTSRARESAARLNAALVGRLRAGVDLTRFAAPLIGSSAPVDVMEGLLIGHLLDGHGPDAEALVEGMMNDLVRSGRSLLRDGKKLEDPAEARVMVGDSVRGLLGRRLAVLRTLGVVS